MKQRKDTYKSVRDEREYGPYWYSLVWRILRPLLILAGSLLVVVGIGSTVWKNVYGEYLAPPDGQSQQQIAFTVESGQSLTRVANNLESAGLIRNRTVFKYYCDFAGMGQKIQAGSYVLSPSMTMTEIADQLTMGDGNPIVRNITLIPGWTLEDFAAKLVKDGVLSDSAEFLEMCRTGEKFLNFTAVEKARSEADAGRVHYALEGYLAPDTYEFYIGATAEDIIRRLLTQTGNRYPDGLQVTVENKTYSMDEILTLASIIEKEAKEEDFARVSAVFHNRLSEGMKLQSDVTIHYITDERKMALGSAELNLEDAYNTYKYYGLPPGPICAPSQAAIEAAMNPDPTYLNMNYMYFCAAEPESGRLIFTKTLEEHEAYVAMYRELWKAYDDSRGID